MHTLQGAFSEASEYPVSCIYTLQRVTAMVLMKHSTHKSHKLNAAAKGDSSWPLEVTMLTLLNS